MLTGTAAAGAAKDHATGSAQALNNDGSLRAHIWVSAHSDGDGQDPHGRVALEEPLVGGRLTADVVCLDIDGAVAAIGAVVTKSDHPFWPVGAEIVQYVRDNGPASAETDRSATTSGDADTCNAAFAPSGVLVQRGNYDVRDQ